jgi:NAD(P)-dependent dehydrogenase (short-subunit alcohol dehydrogenase family)
MAWPLHCRISKSATRVISLTFPSVAARKVFAPIGTVYSATKFAVSAISEGLRAEVGPNIRTTVILPGTTRSELKHSSTDPETAAGVREFGKTLRFRQRPPASHRLCHRATSRRGHQRNRATPDRSRVLIRGKISDGLKAWWAGHTA